MPCITDVMIEFNFLFRIYVMQNKLDTWPWPHYGGTAAVFNTFHCINKSQYRLSLCIPQNYAIKNRGKCPRATGAFMFEFWQRCYKDISQFLLLI